MGEYFNWVNVDKKEYICPADFDYGNKRHESLTRGNEFLCALRELLSDEWRGDRILFFGDEISLPENATQTVIRDFYEQTIQYGYPADAFDMICETYRNVSCLFKTAEDTVRRSIGYYLDEIREGYNTTNEYGIDINKPYDGLFHRTGRDFKYTINHTKRVYYSFEGTKILYLDGAECEYADPLPLLLTYGRSGDKGEWIGDVIGVADEKPEDYELINKIYLDW